MHYLEDLDEDQVFKLGSVTVAKGDMIRFSEEFDPQAFHLDENVAGKMFGGIIASGWHTASMCHRLVVDNFLGLTACMASPGIDNIRFVKPVYADNVLTGRLTVVSTKKSTSKPDRGVAKLQIELFNADDALVFSMLGTVIVACRP